MRVELASHGANHLSPPCVRDAAFFFPSARDRKYWLHPGLFVIVAFIAARLSQPPSVDRSTFNFANFSPKTKQNWAVP